MFKKGLIMFLVLSCAFFAFTVKAQLQNADISLNINPEFPKANESVFVSVETYSTDLNNARITWTLNGQKILEGMGKKSYSFKAGSSGSQSILEVQIETLDGSLIDKSVTISPSSVDMLWMAFNTYVPPFYKGKALASLEGTVKVVAIPSTRNLAGLNYKWKKDSNTRQNESGYEKSFLIYSHNYLEDANNIKVNVSDIFGNNVGYGELSIKYGNPKIIFYEQDPILGVKWEKALGDNFNVTPNGETIVAEPYFFSNKNVNSTNYTFTWSLNGEKIATPNKINTLAIKPEDGTSGTAVIKVLISNLRTYFQEMDKITNANY